MDSRAVSAGVPVDVRHTSITTRYQFSVGHPTLTIGGCPSATEPPGVVADGSAAVATLA
jgi:hypothetical protein